MGMKVPGSPCREQRPASWRSTRRASWASSIMTCRPPLAMACSDRRMSVPRPAMLVATVIWPGWPAAAIMSASALSCAALSTTWGSFAAARCRLASWDVATDRVPIKTGTPRVENSRAFATTSRHFVSRSRATTAGTDFRRDGRFGGIRAIASRYTLHNSAPISRAVPLSPDSRR